MQLSTLSIHSFCCCTNQVSAWQVQ